MDGTKKVSLVFELDVLRQLLLSGRLLAELLSNEGLPDQHSRDNAPRMLEAMLALAASRVRLLSLIVQGEAEAGLIAGPENWAASESDADVLLPQKKPPPRR